MQRRSIKLALVLAGVLSCSLVTGTSVAYYRASIGPKQCCNSHCRHRMPARTAAQCCRTHPGVTPATVAKVAAPDVAAPAFCAVVVPCRSLPVAVVPPRLDERGPPGGTLVAQHTSLAL